MSNPEELSPPVKPTETSARTWAMALHFSQLANFVIPFSGIIAPIVIWQLKKDELPILDAHGKNVINWMISILIYGAVCFVLTFVVIGIPLAFALMLANVIFIIIAAVKASSGEAWKYPGSIPFF
ncbi:MAG: DUF4870 domain-containing protein [Aureliella sp.]